MSDLSDLVGQQVQVPSCPVYVDSYASKRGLTVSAGNYLCNHVANGRIAPIHIASESRDLGWIKASRANIVLQSWRPIYVLKVKDAVDTV
jgi:hypothetical protein